MIKKAKPSRPLVLFLMDQKYNAGIGNYILSEVLYLSKVHPWAVCGEIDQATWMSIYDAIVSIINKSYYSQMQGYHSRYEQKIESSIIQEINENSDLPTHVASTEFRLSVYGCTICPGGFNVVKEVGLHKRSIYWVPKVQTLCSPDDSTSK